MGGKNDKPKPWPVLKSSIEVETPVFNLRRKLTRNPRNSGELEVYVMECGDWINIIALTDAEEVVLVEQYRHGVEEVTLEIPGGMIDEGESPLEAARRELLEETGYAPADLVRIGTVQSQPAIQNNNLHTFLALGAKKVGDPTPDPGEDLRVITVPLAEIDRYMAEGRITHALVLTAFQWLEIRKRSGKRWTVDHG